MHKLSLTKTEKSWILYDVASSAFTMIITATIPIYFRSLTEQAGISNTYSTSLWATSTAIAIAILILAGCAFFLNDTRYGVLALLILFIIGYLFIRNSEKQEALEES